MYTAKVLNNWYQDFSDLPTHKKKKMKKRINKLTSKLSTILIREEKMCKNKKKKYHNYIPENL